MKLFISNTELFYLHMSFYLPKIIVYFLAELYQRVCSVLD